MNKKILLLVISVILILSGCSKANKENVLKEVENKYLKQDSYNLEGNMTIINNEDKHSYDVNVVYEKEEKYKVTLKNQINNHEQIILRNDEGVYVLTPSLNKSFKFQSDWPYNNSQAYLIKNIVDDITNDKKSTFSKKEETYIYTSKVNYSNNKKLVKQKVYIDKKCNLTKIEVLDNKNNIIMNMKINKIKTNEKIDDKYFKLENNMGISEKKEDDSKKTSVLEDVIYPVYMPVNTYLKNSENKKFNNGERVILSYSGDSNFTLIEETINTENTNQIVPVFGEMMSVGDVIGTVTENSVEWTSNGVSYYLASNDMSVEEMLNVANSITVLPVSK